jgi:hypothetical protein
MRACRLFYNALKEDYGQYLYVSVEEKPEFTLDQRATLKQKMLLVASETTPYQRVWEMEAEKADKQIALAQEQFGIFIFMLLIGFFGTFPFYYFAVHPICAFLIQLFIIIFYFCGRCGVQQTILERKLLETIK